MIHSYILSEFVELANRVKYIKYLKHKFTFELFILEKTKRNTIISSPYEYNIYINKYKLLDEQMHKEGLPIFDRFDKIRNNKTEKQCILISFTYRSYNNAYYDISLLKKNIIKLLEDNTLISYLKNKNIDLIDI